MPKPKQHNLGDIRKYITYVPPIFIITFTLLSIFVAIVVNDFQRDSLVKLMSQKYNLNAKFQKKQALDDFILEVNTRVQTSLSYEENNLKYILFETLGYLKSHETQIMFDYIEKLEDDGTLKIVVFDTDTFQLIHGFSTIRYLQNLIFSNIDNELQKINVLKYIYSQGDKNFQYWKNDGKNTIRLSYFAKLEDTTLFVGVFSTVDSLRSITKDMILKHIDKENQNPEYKFWFYDYITNEVYNYDAPSKMSHIYELDSKLLINPIIDYYKQNIEEKPYFNDIVSDYSKYHFLVSIEDKRTLFKQNIYQTQQIIYDEQTKKLQNQLLLICFISFVLLISSSLFTKFITHIFTRYNNEQKKQQELISEWKERYKLAIIASNDGFWDINLDTWDIYFSQRWHEMYGYVEGDVTNFTQWLSLIHQDDKDRVQVLFQEHLNGDSSHFISEYRLKTKANKYKWVLARGKVFWEQKRMLMMSMDIDKPKKMQTELEEAERLVEDGRIVIFRWLQDKRLSVDYVSKSIKNYGYQQSDIKHSSYFDMVYEADKQMLKDSIKKAIEDDEHFFFSSYRIIDGFGDVKWVFSRAIIIKDDFAKVNHFYGYIHDITKIKMSEEELKIKVANEVEKNIQKDRLLIQQSKLASMGEMLGSIAHQWRQPLNNVSLILHFLKDNFDNQNITKEKLEGYVKRAKEQIDYMSDTIDDFKNFFRPSKAKKPFVVSEAIRSALSIISVQLHSSDIDVSLHLGQSVVDGYENEFKQAILNILNNAKDAILLKKQTTQFTPRIEINARKDDKSCTICIFNNGGNISEDMIDKIYEPYFTTKFENKGTGIGLYMCKTIIEGSMGGDIKAKNEKDGVVFEISLPICYNSHNEKKDIS